MISFFRATVFIISALLLFLFCEKKNQNLCKPNQACTEEFRTITVKVEFTDKTPVELDSFKVIDTWSGKDITSPLAGEDWVAFEPGEYILFDDTHLSGFRALEIIVTFKGYIDGLLVAEKMFDVGADCCHVYALSEDLTITIDK